MKIILCYYNIMVHNGSKKHGKIQMIAKVYKEI